MKKTQLLSLFVALITLTSMATAQVSVVKNLLPKFTFGIYAGANTQQLTGARLYSNSYNTGFTGGAFASFTRKKIGLQIEAAISGSKADYKMSPYINYQTGFTPDPKNVNFIYFNLPVLFEYKIIQRLWLQAGPQIKRMISAKDNLNNDQKYEFKLADVSAVLGVQAILPYHITAYARYIPGLTNVNSTALHETWKTRSMQVGVGYRFL